MAYAGGKGLCITLDLPIQTDAPVGFARSNRARSTIKRAYQNVQCEQDYTRGLRPRCSNR